GAAAASPALSKSIHTVTDPGPAMRAPHRKGTGVASWRGRPDRWETAAGGFPRGAPYSESRERVSPCRRAPTAYHLLDFDFGARARGLQRHSLAARPSGRRPDYFAPRCRVARPFGQLPIRGSPRA